MARGRTLPVMVVEDGQPEFALHPQVALENDLLQVVLGDDSPVASDASARE